MKKKNIPVEFASTIFGNAFQDSEIARMFKDSESDEAYHQRCRKNKKLAKQLVKKLYLLFICAAALTGCEKNNHPDSPGQVTIYTLKSGNYNLIIDGVEYGRIKKAVQMPVCGDRLFQFFLLKQGNHVFDAKSSDGIAWGNPKTIYIKEGECKQIQLP